MSDSELLDGFYRTVRNWEQANPTTIFAGWGDNDGERQDYYYIAYVPEGGSWLDGSKRAEYLMWCETPHASPDVRKLMQGLRNAQHLFDARFA